MELINLSPFPSLHYVAADSDRIDHKIVVTKVSYKIQRRSSQQWALELITDASVPLTMFDEFWGEAGESSVKFESDLAPFKPKCDVVLNGTAHTPDHKPMPALAVKLKLSYPEQSKPIIKPIEPKPLNPMMPLTESQKQNWQKELEQYDKKVLAAQQLKYITQIEKTLSILGESTFKPNFLLPGWKRTSLKAFTELPLRWEYSFGGIHKLFLTEQSTEPFYHQACFSNPIGSGWVESQYFDAYQKMNAKRPREARVMNYKNVTAPRIEAHKSRQSKPIIYKQTASSNLTTMQMAKITEKYGNRPQGFGFTGRSWSPRISYSGTYDEKWLEEQHPYPPKDMNYRYWNAAPEDQQIDFFYPNTRLELWNLTHPELSNNGYVCLNFPDHYPFLKLKFESGQMIPWPMTTETVLIDTDNLIISLTHKAWIPNLDPEIVLVEAHFNLHADKKIFELKKENNNSNMEQK